MVRRVLATVVLGFATRCHADTILNESCQDVSDNLFGNSTFEQQDCYDGVYWAKTTGCPQHPGWYRDEGLHDCGNASFRDFQCALFKMKGKSDPGNSHKCPRPCGDEFCKTMVVVVEDDGNIEVVDTAQPTIPPWLVGLLGVSGSGILATLGYLYTKSGKTKPEKKKKRALKNPPKSPEVEEITETTALTQPQSPAAAAPPSPTVQHQYVAAYHPNLAFPHGGSFVAQAMPVAHTSHPMVAHHALGAIPAPPVVHQVPFGVTPTVAHTSASAAALAPPVVHQVPFGVTPTVAHTSASAAAIPTHTSASAAAIPMAPTMPLQSTVQQHHAYTVGGMTPVPAISTPVAAYYHQPPAISPQ